MAIVKPEQYEFAWDIIPDKFCDELENFENIVKDMTDGSYPFKFKNKKIICNGHCTETEIYHQQLYNFLFKIAMQNHPKRHEIATFHNLNDGKGLCEQTMVITSYAILPGIELSVVFTDNYDAGNLNIKRHLNVFNYEHYVTIEEKAQQAYQKYQLRERYAYNCVMSWLEDTGRIEQDDGIVFLDI